MLSVDVTQGISATDSPALLANPAARAQRYWLGVILEYQRIQPIVLAMQAFTAVDSYAHPAGAAILMQAPIEFVKGGGCRTQWRAAAMQAFMGTDLAAKLAVRVTSMRRRSVIVQVEVW